MRARTKLDAGALSGHVQDILNALRFSYLSNRGHSTVEFEVTAPCHLLLRVEDLTAEQIGYPFRSRLRIESSIELIKTIGSKDSGDEARRCARVFVNRLVDSLPGQPWRGFGMMRTRSERANWQRLAEV